MTRPVLRGTVLATPSLVLLGLFFSSELAALFKLWLAPDYSHALLLVPLAFYWGWSDIERAGRNTQPSPALGLGVVALGLCLNLIGALIVNNWVAHTALIVVVLGLCLFTLGPRATLAAWKGFALLLLAIPLPPILMAALTAKMQLVSSVLGSGLLHALAIPVYREGNVIDLGTVKLQVAEACSGLRYLFPLFSFGFILAFAFKIPGWFRALVIALPLPISIVANALRIGFIGWATTVWGPEAATGLSHDVEGWVFIIVCLALLGAVIAGVSFLTRHKLKAGDFFDVPACRVMRQVRAPSWLAGALLVALLAIFGTGKLALEHRRVAAHASVSFDSFPLEVEAWHGTFQPLSAQELSALRLTDYFQANYARPSHPATTRVPVNFYIAYYAGAQLNAAPHSPKVCLPGDGWDMTLDDQYTFTLPNQQHLTVNRAVIRKNGQTMLVYFWLRAGGHDTSSTLEVKGRLLLDALRTGRSDIALIRVTTPMQDINNVAAQDQILHDFIGAAWHSLNQTVPPIEMKSHVPPSP